MTKAVTHPSHQAGKAFPVQGLTIVGIDPILVERVDAHLTWRRVPSTGAASSAWLGLFVSLPLPPPPSGLETC